MISVTTTPPRSAPFRTAPHSDKNLTDSKFKPPTRGVPLEDRPAAEPKAVAFTRNRPAFTRALRNAVFTLVKAFAEGNTTGILTQIEPADPDGQPWTAVRIDPHPMWHSG